MEEKETKALTPPLQELGECKIVWKEEEKMKKEGRKRMSDIAYAEDFYFEMTGNYTLDGKHLFELVEAAMDSLIADSLFVGDQLINLNNITYPVTLERGSEVRVDTTFSFPVDYRRAFQDTIYSIFIIITAFY